MEKKNNGVIIGLLMGMIIMLLIFGCLYATNIIKFNKENSNDIKESSNITENNQKNDKNDSVDFDLFLNNIKDSLGWLVVLHSSPEYGERKNVDYLKSTADKQMFVMEYILSNQDNYKNFVVIDAVSGEKITDGSPTDQITLAYYPYSLFNKEYKKFFNEDFDVSERILPSSRDTNEYEKSTDYVYYLNRRPGRNGQNVSSMIVEDTKYDENNKIYTAKINMIYSDRLTEEIGVSSEKAEITYTINNSNVILKTFIIK